MLVGKTAILPLVGRRLPIVADEAVDQDFGTGAVKVTPGHDATDYEIGERHGLEILTVLHPDGRMDLPAIAALDGKPVAEARASIVEMLKADGSLQKIEPYHHSVGHCSRCGAVIEPMVSDQWWVRMKPLAQPAIEVVERDQIRFHPERFEEQYLRWMRNIRDWCISRQLWLGHRIPVWTCANGHQIAYERDPQACQECGDGSLAQDPDVLVHEEKIGYYRNFANKLWNATRLVLSRLPVQGGALARPERLEPADRWILGRVSAVTRTVTACLGRFEFAPAIDALEAFSWHEFADHYLELMKAGLASPVVA